MNISLDKLMLKENRRILMFLDNCTSHSTTIQNKLTNVKLIFLPANSTSLLQPLDQGIIQNFKVLYRKLLIERILVEIDRERTNAFALANKFSVYDSIQMIYLAWSLVLPMAIQTFCLKFGF